MLVLRGAPALSEFRLAKLSQRLQVALGRPVSLVAEHVHFADLNRDLSDQARTLLGRLLEYGPRLTDDGRDGLPEGRLILAVPRPGTISPWSSKATDIAHNCGLTQIRRLERGTAYYLSAGSESLSDSELKALAAPLHDRMTQAAFFDLGEAERLFGHSEPRPSTRVDVVSGGRAALESANLALGLALSADEIDYLAESFRRPGA